MRWELLRRRPGGCGSIYSQMSPAWHPPPMIPTGIQDEICLKKRLRRQWNVTRDPALKAEINRSIGRWPAGWMRGGTTSGVRHSNPLIPKTNRCGGRPSGWWEFLLRLPLVTPWGIALADSEKAEALTENLETQFQPVTDPSVPAVIEIVDVALRSYFMTRNSEPK